MTSTISSVKANKKNTFLGLVKWSFFSSIPLFVVYCCILALVLPIFIFSAMAEGSYSYANDVFSGFMPVIETIFLIFFGIMMFKDFHNKRSVDLYASFPVKKVTMFLARYVAGLLMLLIPLLLFTFISGLIPNMFPEPTHDIIYDVEEYWDYYVIQPYLPYLLKKCLVMFLSVISSYSMFAVTALLCGTVLSTLISYGIVNVLYPVIVMLMAVIFVNTIPGFQYAGSDGFNLVNGLFVTGLSPNGLLILSGNISYEVAEPNYYGEITISFLPYLIFNLIFIVLMVVAGCFIARKRKNENVQNSFINRISKSIITVFIVTVSAVIGGTIFRTMFWQSIKDKTVNATVIFILGSLIGAIISFVIFTFVYNKGVRGFFKEIPVLCISMGIVVVTVLIIITGCFGADSYIPAEDKIDSVAIVTEYFNANLYQQERYQQYYTKSKKVTDDNSFANIYFDAENHIQLMDYHIYDKTIIEKTRQVHELIIQEIKKQNSPFYMLFGGEEDYRKPEYYYDESLQEYVSKTDGDSVKYTPDIQIQYRLKNGKIIDRNYDEMYCNNDELRKLVNEIISAKVYKQQCYQFVKNGAEHFRSCNISHIIQGEYDENTGVEYHSDKEKMTQLYNTFMTEFMNDTDIMGNIIAHKDLTEETRKYEYTTTDVTEREDDLVLNMTFEQRPITRGKRFDEEYIPVYDEYWYLSPKYTKTLNLIKQYSHQKIRFSNECLYISKYSD